MTTIKKHTRNKGKITVKKHKRKSKPKKRKNIKKTFTRKFEVDYYQDDQGRIAKRKFKSI